jgi:glycosyltransferase involved in cell wall biosynthesis
LQNTLEDRVKVTVGMCVKNSEGTVRLAIDSVINQDFPHSSIELIIVDGNSSDKTLDILKESLRDTDLKVQILTENSGLGQARQMVADNASGDYIVWVDADMILPKSYILKQVTFMDGHPRAGIAAGKYAVYVGQGIVPDLENVVYAVDSVYGEKSASKIGYLPGTEGSIFRVKAIHQVGGFDLHMNGAAEDTEIAYRIRRHGWEISLTNEKFVESTRGSWSSLWAQYFWWGRGGHFVFHKDRNAISLWKMTPIGGFFAGILRTPKAYLLIHKKYIFLLPFHYTYKRIAWLFGFVSAHKEGYGHFKK